MRAKLYPAISQARYSRYLWACKNDKRKASILYRANIALSKELYGVIGVFEIVLRNSIDRYMVSLKGNNWLQNAVQPDGYLMSKGCEHSCYSIQNAIQQLVPKCTYDKLVAKLPFGFWTYLFATQQYAAAGNTLLDIFPTSPIGKSQKRIFKDLVKINEIRNRIAHYEPICFDGDEISTTHATNRYNVMIDLLTWMNYNPKKLLFAIDKVPKAIAVINNLAQKRNF